MSTCTATTEDGDSCKNDAGEGVYCHTHRFVRFEVTDPTTARIDAGGQRITSRTGEGVDRRAVIEQLEGCTITGSATTESDEAEGGDGQ